MTNALLSQFDAVLLENQQLRQQRDEARQQLTHLLYLRDGAARVVGKQIDQIDILKRKIAEYDSGMGEESNLNKQRRTGEDTEGQPMLTIQNFVIHTCVLSIACYLSIYNCV